MSKYWTVVLVAVSLLVVISFAQQSPKAANEGQGRFSLIQAEIPGQDPPGGKGPGLFVIDTQTGRVWSYVPPKSYDDGRGGKMASAQYFFPVSFAEKPFLTEGQIDRPQ